MIFKNRKDAAEKLASTLKKFKGRDDVILLGLARGGIVLAAEMGKILDLPFDLIITRKIGAPDNPELAIGAITETGNGYFNQKIISIFSIPHEYIEQRIEKEKQEALRQLNLYRKKSPSPIIKGKTVIVVDDGIATGATMEAAIFSLKKENIKEIIIAIPVAPTDTFHHFQSIVKEVIVLFHTENFMSVSQFYENFPQVSDEEIIKLLQTR